MQQVRDLLAGQGWYDLAQHRIAPPTGVPMHWTRVVDLPIAAIILLLRPLLGPAQAEIVACVAVPLLSLLAAMALAARLATRLFGRLVGLTAALMVLAAVPASFRMMPMRIDHHAWQFVLAMVALNAMAARNAHRGAALAGAAMALSLAISLEALPLTVIFAGVCTLRFWRGDLRWLATFMATVALGSVPLFLATRGSSDLADHCDALSPVHLGILLWVAAGCALVLPQLRKRPFALNLAVLGAFGAGAVAIMGWRAPQCLGSDAFATLDPLVRAVWFYSVPEGLPVWKQGIVLATTMVLLPAFGLIACWRLWRGAPDADARAWWSDVAVLLAGATLIGLLVARASAVACLFAGVPAAWQVKDQIERWAADPLLLRRMARIPLILFLLLPGGLAGIFADAAIPPAKGVQRTLRPCDLGKSAPDLAKLPKTTLLAGLDIGPALLVTTPHSVVATAHHRGNLAMRDLMVAFLGPDSGVRAIMHRYGATTVVICPVGSETSRYRKLAPDGFMAHLVAGRVPDWLEPVPVAREGGFKVWRIKQPDASGRL
ncbi:MAG: hypothetical protein NTX28_10360 [Novosphingobium sp.]|nr:hypothetical protein [Novosphingobium sp.]